MRSLRLVAAVLSLGLAPFIHAQEAPSPGGPPPASKAEAQPVDIGDVQTLKVNVNLVNVYFSVRDKSGYITNLHKDDCSIYENKELQKTKNFTQEKNLPLTIGILLDTSGSQQRVLPLEQQSAVRFLKDVLTPKDLAFLITFDVNVDLQADDTNSLPELTRAINAASINAATASAGTPGIGGGPFPTGNPRGTLLYDAVYLAAHDKLANQAGRKVLILLTDGGDQGSQETLASATEAAQRSNAILYIIFITAHSFADNFSDLTNPKGAMDHLARATGGRVIDAGNSGPKLEAAFTQIQDELRTQYRLTYTPTTPADSKFHPQEITCGPHHTIATRKGYYALPTDSDDN
jgi:VWFA-related protein